MAVTPTGNKEMSIFEPEALGIPCGQKIRLHSEGMIRRTLWEATAQVCGMTNVNKEK